MERRPCRPFTLCAKTTWTPDWARTLLSLCRFVLPVVVRFPATASTNQLRVPQPQSFFDTVGACEGAESAMLKALIFAAMVDLLSPSVQVRSYLREPVHDAELRYDAIADDISTILSDETEPLLFTGPAGREATGLLLATIAWHESGFRKDVDTCTGALSRGDNGRSVGLLQVMRGPNYEGHTAKEICGDRRLAIRLGLHVLNRAKETCQRMSPRGWVQSFVAGYCGWDTFSARSVCAAFQRVGQKWLNGASCASAGPVTLREASPS